MDVHNFRLTLPTLQYQNRTWTWLDLMMAVKKDYKQVLVGQVCCALYLFKVQIRPLGILNIVIFSTF